ncbi:MAG: ATP synthase F0 subunit A [Candidatus Omnitrophica bacterium CG11_big_fil_rev_8_21_14_0_20_63_9]|nr:MAG: ATP synthase F0 subunit A [Candidatus Omnitrophica bacterium CG11_big_fil_rev_8_21_14_0_20_63_9]
MASDAHHAVEQAVQHGAQAAEAAGHGGGDAIPELPNFITALSHQFHDAPWAHWLHQWENLVFAWLVALILCTVAWRYSRRPATIPGRGQNLLEMLVNGLDQLVQGVIGHEGRHFTPFIGSLFLYIWLMNLAGMVPGLKSPTSNLNTTVALAIVVFCYVQWTGIRRLGPARYVSHLAGEPTDVVGWVLAPLMLVLHVLGEFIKPLSLSLRLCFNVFAEDVLLAVLVGLGIGAGFAIGTFKIGLPFQLFALPLVLIFSTVQALVFSLLSTVYIALMLPHEEHH